MTIDLYDDTLSVHMLNIGDGDSIIVELPVEDGVRSHLVIDSARGKKTQDYLNGLGATNLKLVVATHPHSDHIIGLKSTMEKYPDMVEEFWDSGFRHTSSYWYNLIKYVKGRNDIQYLRPTSGLTTVLAGVEVTVLAPSIYLRNRYDSYGVNINNSSIVLMLEYEDMKVILAGDAQWDSWAKISEEFPHFEKTSNPMQQIKVEENYFPLNCDLLKVAHHGSKHGTALEAIEKLKPNKAVISCGDPSSYNFPHRLATDSIMEVTKNILFTHKGSIAYAIYKGGKTDIVPLGEANHAKAPKPNRL